MTMRDRVKELRRVPASELLANPKNWRIHPEAQRAALRGVLEEIGFADAMIARETPDGLELIDGHLRRDVMGDQEVPVLVVDVTAQEAEKMLLTFDPLSMMAHADTDQLLSLLADNPFESQAVRDMLEALANGEQDVMPDLTEPVEDPGPEIDRAEELREKWQTERGQVWEVGRHRLMCGDGTQSGDVKILQNGNRVRLLVADPPYCSGGFEEAGKKSGSVGTRGTELIHNDQLSTRGYQALIKAVLSEAEASLVYLFTDWRMWVNLFDCVESSGLGVRAMIVWDKGTPGMGRGWRRQHELILCGAAETAPFDPQQAVGNVIQSKRTGNKLHATEKPVDVIDTILTVSDIHQEVYDPFLGSGTTMVAAEQLGRICYGMEIEPKYVAVTLERMAGMGLDPKLIR